MSKTLSELTEDEFNGLKEIGLLWEFYPKSPDLYKDIKRCYVNVTLSDIGRVKITDDGTVSGY